MGENNCWEREVVITELTKGRELMCQLRKHFDPMKQDVCNYLAVEILSSYDKALSLLNGTALSGGNKITTPTPSSSTAKLIESPLLLADSSTKSSGRPCNSRKRKTISRRTVYIHSRSGGEVPPEDGYSWRKYGQKTILGAKYPREYYRCARRPFSDCTATRMVQRSETAPSVLEVIYGGSHSCGQEITNKEQNGETVVQTKETHESDGIIGIRSGGDQISGSYFPEMVVVQTKETHESDGIIGIRSGGDQISGSYFPEMVSTPNNSFTNSNSFLNMANSDIMTTPTSSPHPEWNLSTEDVLDALFSK